MNRVGDTDFYVMTIATKFRDHLKRLEKNAKFYGINYDIKGMGDKRFKEWGTFMGVMIELVEEAIAPMHDDTIVMVIDAYDVLFYATLAEILSKFEAFHTEMLFCCEMNCHPNARQAKEYALIDGAEPGPLPYLNSGIYVGKVGAFRKLFQEFPYKVSDDDQGYYTNCYLSGKSGITLDQQGKMFACLHNVPSNWIHWRNNKWYFKENAVCMLHYNGWAKAYTLEAHWNIWHKRASYVLKQRENITAGIVKGADDQDKAVRITIIVLGSAMFITIIALLIFAIVTWKKQKT